MTLPTRERLVEIACVLEDGPDDDGFSADMQRLVDLALAVLDAPERLTTDEEIRTWGTCPSCGEPNGFRCRPAPSKEMFTQTRMGSVIHPARLAAAPLRVRLVAVL